MSIYDEAIERLPERLETSDFNASLILLGQRNAALQVALGSAAQGIAQGNAATVTVVQVNL